MTMEHLNYQQETSNRPINWFDGLLGKEAKNTALDDSCARWTFLLDTTSLLLTNGPGTEVLMIGEGNIGVFLKMSEGIDPCDVSEQLSLGERCLKRLERIQDVRTAVLQGGKGPSLLGLRREERKLRLVVKNTIAGIFGSFETREDIVEFAPWPDETTADCNAGKTGKPSPVVNSLITIGLILENLFNPGLPPYHTNPDMINPPKTEASSLFFHGVKVYEQEDKSNLVDGKAAVLLLSSARKEVKVVTAADKTVGVGASYITINGLPHLQVINQDNSPSRIEYNAGQFDLLFISIDQLDYESSPELKSYLIQEGFLVYKDDVYQFSKAIARGVTQQPHWKGRDSIVNVRAESGSETIQTLAFPINGGINKGIILTVGHVGFLDKEFAVKIVAGNGAICSGSIVQYEDNRQDLNVVGIRDIMLVRPADDCGGFGMGLILMDDYERLEIGDKAIIINRDPFLPPREITLVSKVWVPETMTWRLEFTGLGFKGDSGSPVFCVKDSRGLYKVGLACGYIVSNDPSGVIWAYAVRSSS